MTLLLIGRQKIECPAFNFSLPINKWHWGPENEQGYEFMNVDSLMINLIQTKYDYNQFEERRCHMCACFSGLDTHYEFADLGIQLKSQLSYQSGENSD